MVSSREQSQTLDEDEANTHMVKEEPITWDHHEEVEDQMTLSQLFPSRKNIPIHSSPMVSLSFSGIHVHIYTHTHRDVYIHPYVHHYCMNVLLFLFFELIG